MYKYIHARNLLFLLDIQYYGHNPKRVGSSCKPSRKYNTLCLIPLVRMVPLVPGVQMLFHAGLEKIIVFTHWCNIHKATTRFLKRERYL